METVPTSRSTGPRSSTATANRARSARALRLDRAGGVLRKPIPLRHPFVFYDGHLPAFSFIVLHGRALGGGTDDRLLETLFERGIDPGSRRPSANLRRATTGPSATVRAFGRGCDTAVDRRHRPRHARRSANPLLVGAEALFNILEHEEMHHETLTYIIHQLPLDAKRGPSIEVRDVMPRRARRRSRSRPAARPSASGAATRSVGTTNSTSTVVDVPAFGIDAFDVTNGDYLAFVRAGGAPPPFWSERDGQWWLRSRLRRNPAAAELAGLRQPRAGRRVRAWAGARLPTEAEYHRAAYGTPAGDERRVSVGRRAAGAAARQLRLPRGSTRSRSAARPPGASAWGVEDLVGNGWEWTSTPFAPFAGFAPMASYPQYSADFFDGRHYVMKGASPVTSTHLIRRSFRNWFFADYPHMYATFRRAYD